MLTIFVTMQKPVLRTSKNRTETVYVVYLKISRLDIQFSIAFFHCLMLSKFLHRYHVEILISRSEVSKIFPNFYSEIATNQARKQLMSLLKDY